MLNIERPTAAMKGAVISKVPVKLVKWRIMRASCGIASDPVFSPKEHPEGLKFGTQSMAPTDAKAS